MSVRTDRFFSSADLAAIAEATRRAEQGTSAEIVAFVVGQCDGYEEAPWKGALLGALAAVGAAGLAHVWSEVWGVRAVVWITLPALLGAAVGYVAASLSESVRRFLVPPAIRALNADRRARIAFLDEEVFRTRDRTGILLFAALFEHRVVVLADKGINAKVEQREWDEVTAHIVAGIRAGKPGPAFVQAIEECAELLDRRGVSITRDDQNELGDAPRLRDS